MSLIPGISRQGSSLSSFSIEHLKKNSVKWRPDERILCMAKKSRKNASISSSTSSSSTKVKGNDSSSRAAPPPSSAPSTSYAKETRRVALSLQSVSKVTPMGKQILKNINLGMYMGAKIGILGSNGSGKSSLLKILAGVDKNFDGEVFLDRNINVGYLAQEPVLDDGATVMENIEPALSKTRKLLADFEEVSTAMAASTSDMNKLMSKMEKLQDALDACNGWELDRQVERALTSLKCPPPNALISNLSGGELRRVALCRLLLQSPDILLLDEPTNHLDAEAVAWLEQYLAGFSGTVVAVTHDRYFLDNVAGWILELDRGQGIPFEGNYSTWLQAKERRISVEEKEQTALKRTIARELEWIRRKSKGQQKKGRARENSYEELLERAKEHEKAEKLQSIYLPPGPRLGNVVVEAENLRKDVGGRTLFQNLSFSLPPAGIVGVIGANGTGKTTLFRMIVGQDSADTGYLRIGETVAPLYVDQSRESLNPGRTVFEEVSGGDDEVTLGKRTVSTRAYLSWFNFKGADQQKLVESLSGGERNRLHLAKVLKTGGNLLLLDEPTNDLDVDTLRTLEEAICNFAGSAIVISHDRWFLDRIATHILAFEGSSEVTYFEGSYSEYEAARSRGR